MRLIDADALIEFCAERWIPLNIDAVNMQPTIRTIATDTNVDDKTGMKRYCRYHGIMCEFATEYGYCQITACAKK